MHRQDNLARGRRQIRAFTSLTVSAGVLATSIGILAFARDTGDDTDASEPETTEASSSGGTSSDTASSSAAAASPGASSTAAESGAARSSATASSTYAVQQDEGTTSHGKSSGS